MLYIGHIMWKEAGNSGKIISIAEQEKLSKQDEVKVRRYKNMANILPLSDLRNYNEVLKIVIRENLYI